jgi:hypothetical protein
LGFQHSGIEDNIYADKTGYMGYAVNQIGAPRKSFVSLRRHNAPRLQGDLTLDCSLLTRAMIVSRSFQNAHKHWLTGWFHDRTITVNPHEDGTSYMRLVGFVDASDDRLQDKDVVIVHVLPHLYFHFNVAKGYNADAVEPDTITVVEALGDDKVSTRKSILKKSGDSYKHVATGKVNTVIEVCSMVVAKDFVSHATISVHLEDGKSACGSPDGDLWAPGWNDNVPATKAPVPAPGGGSDSDNDDTGGTPEDNDGSTTTNIRLTLQPATAVPTAPIVPTGPAPTQPTPTSQLPPVKAPSGTPIDPSDPFGGVIDEEEDPSAKVIGISASSVIGGLLFLAGLVFCAVRDEMPLARMRAQWDAKEEETKSQQTRDGSSDKSSNKDHQEATEREADDWWGGDWFVFDFAKTVDTCNRTVGCSSIRSIQV